VAERQCRAVELRLAGGTLKQIADALGYASPSGAAQAIVSALRKRVAEVVDDHRQVEYLRLEAMWMAIYPAAKRGDLAAIDRAVKIMTRRAKLLGLDVDRSNATEFNPEPIRLLVEKVTSGAAPIVLADPAA
jgi:transcriptional regulator